MDAARSSYLVWWIWAVILITSLIAVVGFARAGSTLFWKVEGGHAQSQQGSAADTIADRPSDRLAFTATFCVIGALLLLTILADPVAGFLTETVVQLYAPNDYVDAVLQQGQG